MTALLRQMRSPGKALRAAGLALLCMASPVRAQTCTVNPVLGNFGNVDILSGAADTTTGTFTVSCSGTSGRVVRLCVDISYGNNYGGSTTQRSLVGSSNGLTFDLYTSSAYSTIWGSWGAGSAIAYATAGIQYDLTLTSGGTITSPPFTVYGRVFPTQQTARPGAYTWTSGTPGIQYDYRSGGSPPACPTGTRTALAGAGATVWSATILANCLVSATSINFGSTGFLTANIDATGTITATCTNTTPYIIGLNGGLSGATNPAARKMTKGAENLTYGLYRDLARSQVWGSTTGVDTASGTGTGLAQSYTVYGRTFLQTTPSPGVYNDTINVTVTF